MESWIKLRKQHLLDRINQIESQLREYRKIDLSALDNFNKDNVNKTIEQSHKLINEYAEEIKIIDKS